MRQALYVVLALIALCMVSCEDSISRYDKAMNDAERVMPINTDSAMTVLERIDPSSLKDDSLRAKYHYLLAFGHIRQNRSMIGDSLVSFAHKYYSGKDVVRDVRSGTAYAWYKFWVGDTPRAIAMLDSLAGLPNVPDSIMVQTLRTRVLLGAAEYQGRELVPLAKRLESLEIDSLREIEAKYMLLTGYEYAGELDSALYILNELVDYARKNKWGEKHFLFDIERAQLLTEQGKNTESDALIDEIFRKAGPDNGAASLLHFQYAINALNSGDTGRASQHLAIADSLASRLRGEDEAYFRSYSNLIHAIIDFKQTGRIKLMHINALNNRQSERYNRMKASQWESERGALQQQARALALKAESQHKTVVILVIAFIAFLIAVGAVWVIRRRRLRERENEERAEALQKMVDELKSAPAQMQAKVNTPEALRRAMLQQLGIIKMVAETPTEQNREMLRKISSIESDTDGELVNWDNVYELINTLYAGFYDKLQAVYSDLLTPKEKQIIVLMVAGFSTKEIGVITRQTTSTIYVRKSSIRKKIGVPEKQDIVAFLRKKTPD
ncbi:MAG: helix-turn-helix domain-containing protein [Bacteroidales bacterium]|nr:helix-turn-helix domain-containing protein [Bacteroidales bacterium]